jgi:integrase
MKRKSRSGKRSHAKTILRLPDLEVAKTAVINSLSCPVLNAAIGMQSMNSLTGIARSCDYRSARQWWSDTECIRNHGDSRQAQSTSPGSGAPLGVRSSRLRLLSADLAAGIRRVKGVKKLGVRLGNWLTPEQGNALWQARDPERLRGKRDRAILAVLLACGIRRHEIAELTVEHLRQREGHWAIVDLVGKGRHIRTIPVPDWVHRLLGDWTVAAGTEPVAV